MSTSIKKLRLLSVIFDTKINPWELDGFRAAVAHKVGLEHSWFHNHDNSSNPSKLIYRYPLIQYKLHRLQPMLLCLEHGVEEVQRFFMQPDWTLNIKGKQHAMRVKRLDVQQYNLRVLQQPLTYRIHNWLALNQENFQAYQKIRGLREQITFLEQIFIGHILGFATGVSWELGGQLRIRILEKFPDKFISFKKNKMQAFNFTFEANVFLPDFIGLGKGPSHGFGVVKSAAS